MSGLSGVFTRIVTLVGATMVMVRRMAHGEPTPAWGSEPAIPAGKPQGGLPTLKMPAAQGWAEGQLPATAAGLKVNAFARDLEHPRWIYVLPNGDVLVAEATQTPPPEAPSLFAAAAFAIMARAGMTHERDGKNGGLSLNQGFSLLFRVERRILVKHPQHLDPRNGGRLRRDQPVSLRQR